MSKGSAKIRFKGGKPAWGVTLAPQAGVRLERLRDPAFPEGSRARIGSKCRLPGLQGTYRHSGCQQGLAKSLFQKGVRPFVVL